MKTTDESSRVSGEHLLARLRQQPWIAPLTGGALSLLAIIYVAAGAPGAGVVRWGALLPVCVAALVTWMAAQHGRLTRPVATLSEDLKRANEALTRREEDLLALRDMMGAMGESMDRAAILDGLIHALTDHLHFERGLVLVFDDDKNALTFGAYSHAAPDSESQFLLEQIQIEVTDDESDPLLGCWQKGEPVFVEDATPYQGTRLSWLLTTLDLRLFYSVPLHLGERFRGVVVVDNSPTGVSITQEQRALLDALAAYLSITLESTRLYQHTDEQLGLKVRELEILSRIDRELNYTLSVNRVLTLTVDWVLRFTGSNAAAVALVDRETSELRFVAGYGYEPAQWDELQRDSWPLERGITGRVARTGEPENVPDVSLDPDFVEVVPGTKSQLTVPVTREDRVVAVISLDSQTLDAFTDDNLEFVKRLAARAAAAIDNARLFDATRVEQQKLEIVLRSTADPVIVVDQDGRLVLVNQAALGACRLSAKETYTGRYFSEVFQYAKLKPLFDRALALKQAVAAELPLPNERTYHVAIGAAPEVGWSIVMHDVTPFKETEQLKNELVATTSHDLKNPLSTILGYIDLITMTNKLNDQGLLYVKRVQQAVSHMRQLIDDLLDMARIESGIQLNYAPVPLQMLVERVSDRFTPQLTEKAMKLSITIPPDLPPIPADENRLSQILANLVSNAIKYTPPEGRVSVRAEMFEGFVQVAVQDTGLGISPEDQAQVFARFYRVRTPETDGIEGTGLGLAIVKSLVELHGGQIGLESRVGEGSTFYFTLPLSPPVRADVEQAAA